MRAKTAAMIGLLSSLALATAASAQRGGGLGHLSGGPPVGMPSSVGLGPSVSAGARAGPGSDFGVTTRDAARANSQGAANASVTGREHADANSAIASGADTSALVGLSDGMTVKDSSGAVIGTVKKIERSSGGAVRNVLVTAANGEQRTLRLAPSSLTVSGGVVVTSATRFH